MVQYNKIQKAMPYMYCACALSIANAKLLDLHQQTGDIQIQVHAWHAHCSANVRVSGSMVLHC